MTSIDLNMENRSHKKVVEVGYLNNDHGNHKNDSFNNRNADFLSSRVETEELEMNGIQDTTDDNSSDDDDTISNKTENSDDENNTEEEQEILDWNHRQQRHLPHQQRGWQ